MIGRVVGDAYKPKQNPGGKILSLYGLYMLDTAHELSSWFTLKGHEYPLFHYCIIAVLLDA